MAQPRKSKTKTKRSESSAAAFTYTNRRGDIYYLHEGQTKTGKPRYFFARTCRAGALASVPEGFEVTESINAVVSLRRIKPGCDPIPAADLRVVESELGRHRHLRYHRAQAEDGEIQIYAPDTSPELYEDPAGFGLMPFASARQRVLTQLMARTRYSPVMKFVREGGPYAVMRMTYRGKGGWSWPLGSGTIAVLAKQFIGPIGTEAFFELY